MEKIGTVKISTEKIGNDTFKYNGKLYKVVKREIEHCCSETCPLHDELDGCCGDICSEMYNQLKNPEFEYEDFVLVEVAPGEDEKQFEKLEEIFPELKESECVDRMKSFTDIDQSKKLSEILPIESADMWWAERYAGGVENYEYIMEEKPVYYLSFTKPSDENYSQDTIKDIPCWSLAALLEQFEDTAGIARDYGLWFCYDNRKSYCTKHYDNPVDACYEMILKLHELNLL